MARFKLGRPPIVESWIGFDFEPKADKVAWDGQLANQLVDSLVEDFPKKDLRYRSEVQVVAAGPGQLPMPKAIQHKLEMVRVQNETATRVLQIGDDRLFLHQLKGEEEWPGFESLMEETLGMVDRYTEVFQPSRIRLATLHDVDIVKIPLEGQPIELDDYFKLVRELPQNPFGLIQGYSTAYVTVSPHDGEPLQITLQLLPSPPESGMLTFRIDWHKRCGKIDFSDRELIRSGLRESHEFVVNCFKASFEQKTLDLFEPQDG